MDEMLIVRGQCRWLVGADKQRGMTVFVRQTCTSVVKVSGAQSGLSQYYWTAGTGNCISGKNGPY